MSDDLRSKVLEAADELGYRVNLVGRALRQRRSSTAGLIVPDLDNPFFSALAQHLSRTFAPSGMDLLVFSADRDLDAELRGAQSFVGRQVDALILIPCHEAKSERSIAFASRSVVTIQLDRRVAPSTAHFVGCDNFLGMHLVREHVDAHVDTARQPVIYVGGDRESSSGHERLEGFRREFGDDSWALDGSFDANWGIEAAETILARGFHSATVVTAADVIALGLLSQLQARGFSVPEDFRVVGFDGIGVSHLARPSLTTIRQPVEDMSRMILDLVTTGPDHGGARPDVVRLPPQLILGSSSPAAAQESGKAGRLVSRT